VLTGTIALSTFMGNRTRYASHKNGAPWRVFYVYSSVFAKQALAVEQQIAHLKSRALAIAEEAAEMVASMEKG
jgi:hypothetical protein